MTKNEIKQEINCPDMLLLASLYIAAKQIRGTVTKDDLEVFFEVVDACKLDTSFFPIKNPSYSWSNSRSANESENTWTKRFTYRFWKAFLRPLGLDIKKGLNGDQLRAFSLWLYINKENKFARGIAKRLLWGFVFRLGFYPSLMEHVFFKPQALVLVFKMFPILKPLYWLAYILFYAGCCYEAEIPISESTTNKIAMLPTCLLLRIKLPDKDYIRGVYDTYFERERIFIGKEMTNALLQFAPKA